MSLPQLPFLHDPSCASRDYFSLVGAGTPLSSTLPCLFCLLPQQNVYSAFLSSIPGFSGGLGSHPTISVVVCSQIPSGPPFKHVYWKQHQDQVAQRPAGMCLFDSCISFWHKPAVSENMQTALRASNRSPARTYLSSARVAPGGEYFLLGHLIIFLSINHSAFGPIESQ